MLATLSWREELRTKCTVYSVNQEKSKKVTYNKLPETEEKRDF